MFVLLYTTNLLAQTRGSDNWYFGNSPANMVFDQSPDREPQRFSNQAQPFGSGGSAVATNPKTGELLFYTDGDFLYDYNHNELARLNGITNSQQPAVIVPNSANLDTYQDPTSYYVFVNTGGEIQYYTVNVDQEEGPINVTFGGGPQSAGVFDPAGAMTVVSNGANSYYLIAQSGPLPNAQLEVVSIDNGTVSRLTPTDIAGDLLNLGIDPPEFEATNFNYSERYGLLAVTTNTPGLGVLVLAFDESDGSFSLDTEYNIPGTGGINGRVQGVSAGETAFDTEWAEDSVKLYISTNAASSGRILQYDPATDRVVPLQSFGTATSSYGLQNGPDGNIYHLSEQTGPLQVGRISDIDSVAALTSYEYRLFNGENFNGVQFPQFAPPFVPNYQVTFAPAGPVCEGNTVSLVPEVFPEPDSIVWFIDGQPVSAYSPTYTPQSGGGGAAVGLVAFYKDTIIATQQPLPVTSFQAQPQIPQDTTLCPDEVWVADATVQSGGQGGGGGSGGGGGGQTAQYEYLWSTGATTPQIEIDTAARYWVVIRDPNSGCGTYFETNVKEYNYENITYNTWYFGNGAGLDFNNLAINPNYDDDGNDGTVLPLSDGASNAPEAIASISDSNGDDLYYTDGENVYVRVRVPDETEQEQLNPRDNDTHIQLDGTLAGSNEATMAGIVQVPEAQGLYYLFYTTAVEDGGYNLYYAVVDLRVGSSTIPNALFGTIVSADNLLFRKSTERVKIVGGQNGGPATLIAHEYGNNIFRVYDITAQGIGNPIFSTTGSVHDLSEPTDAEGYIEFGGNENTALLAVALGGEVEVFEYDAQERTVSEPITVSVPGESETYGLEFVGDSLIISGANDIYAADLSPYENTTADPQGVGPGFGAIQRGPDGQIYTVRDNSAAMWTVQVAVGSNVTVQESTTLVFEGGATTRFGLPDYIAQGGNSFQEPGASVTSACVGVASQFAATPTDQSIDSVTWTIQRQNMDGTTTQIPLADSLINSFGFEYNFASEGDYVVNARISNRCGLDTTITLDVNVPRAVLPTLPISANLCTGPVEVTAIDTTQAVVDQLTFEWIQQGALGGGNIPAENTVSLNEEGFYNVTMTDANGCIAEDSIFIGEDRPPLELGEDLSLCVGEPYDFPSIAIASPAPDPEGYSWSVNGTNVSNTPNYSLNTANAGAFEVIARVTDDSPEGCFREDTLQATVNPSPEFNLAATPTDNCGAGGGAIDLTITNTPPDVYSFNWTDINGATAGTTEDLSDLNAGTFNVQVTNSFNCTTDSSVAVPDGNSNFEITNVSTQASCAEANEGRIILELSPNLASQQNNVSYTLRDEQGNVTTVNRPNINSSDSTLTIPNVIQPGLAPGDYTVEVTGPSGCLQSAVATIEELPEIEYTIPLDFHRFCIPNGEVEEGNITVRINDPAQGNSLRIFWSPPGNSGFLGEDVFSRNGENSFSANSVVPTDDFYVFRIEDRSNNLCSVTDSIRVQFNETPRVTIATQAPGSCGTGEEVLRAIVNPPNPSVGSYSYDWVFVAENSSDSIPLGSGRQVTGTQSGFYGVEVTNTESGCVGTNGDPFTVNQNLDILITSDFACRDGEPITVVAETVEGPATGISYRWVDPNNFDIGFNNDTLELDPDQPEGTYTLLARVAGSPCEPTERTFELNRNPVPVSGLMEGPRIICTEDPDPTINSVELNAGEDATQYNWTLPDNSSASSQDLLATIGGIFTVELTNSFNCVTTDSIQILNDCEPKIFAPNIVVPSSPNAQNRVFTIGTKYVADEDFQVLIYNRWGELVYQSSDKDFRWDGTMRGEGGKEVPLGDYNYVITFRSTTSDLNQVQKHYGGVTIAR